MKHLLFSFLLTSISLLSYTQNWSLFAEDSTYNFNINPVHGVKVDSVEVNSFQTTYFFNPIFNDTIRQNINGINNPVRNISQPNIFGSIALRVHDSVILSNQFGSSLYLKPKSPLNHSWDLMTMPSGKITATIDSAYTDSVNHLIDSIKRISFQYFDNLNNPQGHQVNNMKFIISKNNGIISTPNFYENIEGNSANINYKKRYQRNFTSTYLTKAQLYELDVNDEYHLRTELRPLGPSDTRYVNHKVTSKTTSANRDTITMTIQENVERRTLVIDYSTNPPTTSYNSTFSTATITKKIINPDEVVNRLPSLQPRVSSNQQLAYINQYSYFLSYIGLTAGPFNNRIIYQPESMVAIYDSSLNSWYLSPQLNNPSYSYLEGLMKIEYYVDNTQGGRGTPIETFIQYFKKSSETWGTPRYITQVKNIELSNPKAHIYPNPASRILNIEFSKELTFADYQIKDLNGSIVESGKFSNYLNIENLSSGTYIIRLLGNQKVEEIKFIKK